MPRSNDAVCSKLHKKELTKQSGKRQVFIVLDFELRDYTRGYSDMIANNAMLDYMHKETTAFFTSFHDDAAKMSGWGHNYFCEEDGGMLVFALDSPDRHVCPICGHVYTSQKYCYTWTYLYRVRAVQETYKSAYLYKLTGQSRFLDYVKTALRFYAANYRAFVLHVKDELCDDLNKDVGGAARVMPQGLNESIALTKLLLAMDILGDALDLDFVQSVKADLFIPAIDDVLAPQLNLVHNIKCWVNSAIGMAGIFFNEKRWIDLAFDGEYNIGRQLREGVTADKFWYEGSIHYNFFTLEAVISLLFFCKKYARPFGEEEDIPRQMLIAAYIYAFDNGILPNPNDGWPDVNLKTYLFVYKMGQGIYDCAELLAITHAIENLAIPRIAVPLWDAYHYDGVPLEALLSDVAAFDTAAPTKGSTLYPASNFAMLRQGGLNLFLKYGHNGPSHAHPDKMTFELMLGDDMITRDLSNAGYGAKLCNEWHRMSASHNTVVVDGSNHTNTDMGEVIRYSDNEIIAKAQAYEGITFERGISISNSKIADVFKVAGHSEHVFDYFLHIDGDILCDGGTTPADLEFKGNGYQHIKNVVKVLDCNEITVLAGTAKCKLSIEHGEIFICDTLDNPVTRHRKTLVVRQRGKNAAYKIIWQIGAEQA